MLAVLLSAGGANAAKVACGNSHTCAIRDDGNVWCWGTNQGGQLGMGSTGGSSANPVGPVDLGAGRTIFLLQKTTKQKNSHFIGAKKKFEPSMETMENLRKPGNLWKPDENIKKI